MAETTTDAATPKPGHNGFDPGKLKSYMERIDRLNEEIASSKAANAKRCRELKDDIEDVLDEAKSNGIPKKEMKAHLKRQDYLRKADAAREKLEPDEQDTLDQIEHALGKFIDTPLGQAAVSGAPAPKGGFRDTNAKQEAKEKAEQQAAE